MLNKRNAGLIHHLGVMLRARGIYAPAIHVAVQNPQLGLQQRAGNIQADEIQTGNNPSGNNFTRNTQTGTNSQRCTAHNTTAINRQNHGGAASYVTPTRTPHKTPAGYGDSRPRHAYHENPHMNHGGGRYCDPFITSNGYYGQTNHNMACMGATNQHNFPDYHQSAEAPRSASLSPLFAVGVNSQQHAPARGYPGYTIELDLGFSAYGRQLSVSPSVDSVALGSPSKKRRASRPKPLVLVAEKKDAGTDDLADDVSPLSLHNTKVDSPSNFMEDVARIKESMNQK